MAMSGNGQNIGRLWVAIDADTKGLTKAFGEVESKLKGAQDKINGMGGSTSGGGMDKIAASAKKAAAGMEDTGNAAKRAMRPTTALNYTMLRLSQAFVNLRYGNPIGVIAGLGQAAASASRGLKGMNLNVKSLGMSMKGLSLGAAGFAVILPAIATAIAALPVAASAMFAKVGLSAAADLEMLKIQYEGMLGSAERAQQEVDYLMALGAESVVPTSTILEANRQLLAFGITADGLRQNLVKFMSDYGSAAGLTSSQVQSLGYVLGQINAQGKALTQDIRQLAGASIGADKLAAALDMSTAEFYEMVQAGKATSDVLLPAILKIGEGSAEAAAKARNSARGVLNNLKDIAQVNMAQAFEDLLERLKPILLWVEDFIEAFDFTWIAKSTSQVVTYFKDLFQELFGNTTASAADTGAKVSEVIGHIINVTGYALKKMIQYWTLLFYTVQSVYFAISSIVQGTLAGIVDNFGTIVGWLATVGEALGYGWGDTLRQMEQGAVNWANNTAAAADAAGGAMIDAANNAGTAWSNLFDFSDFKLVTKDWDNVKKSAEAKPVEEFGNPFGDGDGAGGAGGGKGKEDPRFKKWIEWLKTLQKLIEQFNAARYDLIRLQEGRFGTEGELSKMLSFGDSSTNFQGDVDQIIAGFDKTADAVRRYYDAVGGGEDEIFGAKAAKAARAERKRTIDQLRNQTQQLVDLAEANKQIQEQLSKYREAEVARLAAQLEETERIYQGFIGADGYYIKGRIQVAQDALDRATEAYENANSRLQDMLSERDQFLQGIRDSARSFVNALSVQTSMVEEFRRLDDLGSFAMTEKRKSESLKEQMKARLETLKEWAKNVKLLREKGLNSDLLRDLIAAGPEASGEAVSELANSGAESIDEINAIQSELASVTSGVQDTANSAFFATAISAQQNLVNSLAAQQEAARVAAEAAEAEYNRIKMELEATQKAVEEGTDAHSLELKAQMEANAKTAAEITESITESLKWLTDKKNPFSAKKMGKSVIDGLIKGLEAKEPALIAKARAIADAVSRTIAAALQINSPSKLMIQYGAWVGEGLALGMDSSLSKVEAASVRMAGVSVPDLGSGDGKPPTVKVYVGDTELKEIVDVQIEGASARDLNTVLAGRRN